MVVPIPKKKSRGVCRVDTFAVYHWWQFRTKQCAVLSSVGWYTLWKKDVSG